MRTAAIEPVQIQDDKVMMTLTIGMACNEDTNLWDLDKLIEIADSALYAARENGGNQSLLGDYS